MSKTRRASATSPAARRYSGRFDLAPTFPARPREGGDPARPFQFESQHWIPAYAGMSGEWDLPRHRPLCAGAGGDEALAREFVGALVHRVTGVALHPVPLHLVLAKRGIEALP